MIFLTAQWEWELQRGPQISPTPPHPLNFFRLLEGRWGSLNIFPYRPTQGGGGRPPEGVSVKKLPCRYITNNNDKKDKKYKKHAVPPYKTITFSTH